MKGISFKKAPLSQKNQRPASNSIILIGDSLTAANGGKSTATPVQTLSFHHDSKGMHRWANAYLGQALSIVGNSAIGGQGSGSILARFTTDALNHDANIISILAGTNDPAGEATTANLQAMYDAALAAGRLVLAHTIPPTTTAGTGVETHRLTVNDWIRRYARSKAGIVLADIAAAWQDPALSGFKVRASYVHDGTHPNTAGGAAAGRVIADALRPFIPDNTHRATVAYAPHNLLSNPLMNGSGTALPSGWVVGSGSATYSYVTRTDGFAGQALRVVVPEEGFFSLATNVNLSAGVLAVGDMVEFGALVEVVSVDQVSAARQGVKATSQCYNGSAFTTSAADLYQDGGTTYGTVQVPGPYPRRMRLRTPSLAVAAGSTLVQSLVSFNGGGTFDVMDAYLRNLTKMGI